MLGILWAIFAWHALPLLQVTRSAGALTGCFSSFVFPPLEDYNIVVETSATERTFAELRVGIKEICNEFY